ncbi:hypothetical protein [Roseicella frigidaeris]|uniref:Outer membrane protein assembly factor BamE n=1 Tax=Roseicella frigidaeris TaxID=2230885 RepID=A0A327MA44_9PROT|nr:hypothetical protein [Roseicella frigidaeris]RAI59305.1 hypothetical protein DOO78_09770 [Roseicella frigidaeris]
MVGRYLRGVPRLLLLPALLLPLLLAACASEPPIEVRLQPFVGKTEAELVQALGIPNATYEAGGDRFLQYEERTSTVYPGDPFWGGFGYRRFGAPIGTPPLVIVRNCSVTFLLRQGRVAGFTFRGNGCR